MLDCSAQLEDRLARAKGKVAACATAARVLLNTGFKHARAFSDELQDKPSIDSDLKAEFEAEPPEDRMRRYEWIRYYVRENDLQKASDCWK